MLDCLQAIAIASCLMDEEGSILVVCPAVLRFSWAEELERWLPFCLPSDIHLGIVLMYIFFFLLLLNKFDALCSNRTCTNLVKLEKFVC